MCDAWVEAEVLLPVSGLVDQLILELKTLLGLWVLAHFFPEGQKTIRQKEMRFLRPARLQTFISVLFALPRVSSGQRRQ